MTDSVIAHEAYAGEISAQEAWDMLASDPRAQLVDVRTQPEWVFAGLPKLSSLNKKTLTLSWKLYPTMELNTHFISSLKQQVPDLSAPLLFLCKTGGRSLDAAIAATQAGYTACYNVTHGFEGDQNQNGQRGCVNGWKSTFLPWEQA